MVYVAPDDVLNAILSVQHDKQVLCVRRIVGIPEGATVESVSFCDELRAFRFMVEHPSFDPVAPGCRPEALSSGIWSTDPHEVLLLDEPGRKRIQELENMLLDPKARTGNPE